MSSRTGPSQKRSQSSLVWTYRERCMDAVYTEHCHGPVFKHEISLFNIDRPLVKWSNWSAFQSGFSYGNDRKHSGDGRQVKRALGNFILFYFYFLFCNCCKKIYNNNNKKNLKQVKKKQQQTEL